MSIGKVQIDGSTPFFILGPCVIESEEMLWEIAVKVKELATVDGLPVIFKASYDKANRSSAHSYRGIGCEEGCRLLASVGRELGMPVTTDVHTVEEIAVAREFVDLIQIPAFLCRQTDLLCAAAESGVTVNVKKGQFLAPWDMDNIAEKLRHFGCRDFIFTERGASFGYNNLVADMRSLYWMRQKGYRVVFDATHSVQRPGGQGDHSGGDGELAPVLARAAVAAGCDGVFMETHPDPAKALSDGPNMIPLENLPALVRQLTQLHQVVRSSGQYQHA